MLVPDQLLERPTLGYLVLVPCTVLVPVLVLILPVELLVATVVLHSLRIVYSRACMSYTDKSYSRSPAYRVQTARSATACVCSLSSAACVCLRVYRK